MIAQFIVNFVTVSIMKLESVDVSSQKRPDRIPIAGSLHVKTHDGVKYITSTWKIRITMDTMMRR